MSLEHCSGVFFELGKKMRPDLFRKHYALCNGVFACISFSGSLLLLTFNFFSRLFFQLVYREFSNYQFITCIRTPARFLGWSFLRKQLTTEFPLLFLRISPSYMLYRVFNRLLRWCIWCNLDGMFLIRFSTFSIPFSYLNIGNFFAFIL